MKIYSVFILYKHSNQKASILKYSHDLSSFGWFQRAGISEFMKFTSKILVERTPIGTRQSVKEQEYMANVYVRGDNLSGCIISDQEYPNHVAHTLLNKLLNEFSKQVPSETWPNIAENAANYNELNGYLVKYQNPKEADPLTKLQMDINETKIILYDTIEAFLQRGEKLDDLVSKSEYLSLQSKMFYETAKKTNRCCTYF